jgi:serine/threonine-protein kinase
VTVDVTAGSVLAGFRVERLLGRGGMGAVYLAEDVHLRRKVAIKVLAREVADDERFRRRFLVESQLAASLEHPHIVPIYAAGDEDGVLYLAMKYVEGFDLRALIEARERVAGDRTVALLGQIGDALDTAHALGLVHRDVKPANILIGAGDDGPAYLCDFGLARHAATAESLTGNPFVGTLAYVAPEQIEGGPVDARADVYSLGCVLYECLTGAPPFAEHGDLSALYAHVNAPPPLVTARRPDLARAIDAVVAQALAKAPDDRCSTCGELVAAAGEALAVAPPQIVRATRRSIPGIRTFLIADIRGYTSFTAEHGDEAAARLAMTFADVVRQVMEAREGRLIELRGDEALVVFDSARQALRAARELQARIAADGLERGVGVGLDAGEAIPVSDGYRGGALNLAARLCSLAGPGEVLASETVVQLARAIDGIRYGERRSERVKGIAHPVTAVEVLGTEEPVRRRRGRRLRRTLAHAVGRPQVRLAAVAAILVAAGVALLAGLGGGGSAPARIGPQSVGFVSPAGKVENQVAVGGLGDLGQLGNTLWVGNGDDKTLERIDLRTHELLHPFVSVQNGVADITAGLGAVWVVDGRDAALLRVDPQYLTIDRIPLPAKRSDIDFTAPTQTVIGDGSVWVAEASKVFRVDPATRRVVKTIDVPEADLLAYGDGALWVGQSNISTVSEIDPKLNQVTKTVRLRSFITSLAVGGGFAWATVVPDDTLWKIDQNGSVDKTIDVGHGPGDVEYFDGAPWLSMNGSVQRVDPRTDAIEDHPVAGRPGELLAGDGVLYVSTDEDPPKLPPLPAAKVATISLAEDWLDDTDPAHAFPAPQFRAQFDYATSARLLGYPPTAGPPGTRLRPEVAAAMPALSADGRTYTFRIRPGFRFSPPSNEPVTAETFRYSIERALSPKLGTEAPGFGYVGDIEGAGAFHAGRAAHISGIAARGDTLTIRLVAPAADFPMRLATPFFTAVPIGTPIVKGGVQDPIPSAGPYYLRVSWQGEIIALDRNPNYHGPRPTRSERILYDLDNNPRRTIDQIEHGRADYAADVLQQPQFAIGGPLAAQLGRPRSGGPPTPRLVQTPQMALSFLQLNTARGPFTDVRLRRAVNSAIDRRALAAVEGQTPSAGYLPPMLSGPRRAPVYALTPDLARARALAHGTRARVVLYTCTRPECLTTARIVRANLAPIGLSVRIARFDDPFGAAARPGARYDILVSRWYWDWPDTGQVLNLWFNPEGYRPPWAPSLVAIPAANRRELERAGRLQGPAREAAYQAAAVRLERDVAPFAAYATPLLPELFSARAGCAVTPPVVGATDLGSLCLRKG